MVDPAAGVGQGGAQPGVDLVQNKTLAGNQARAALDAKQQAINAQTQNDATNAVALANNAVTLAKQAETQAPNDADVLASVKQAIDAAEAAKAALAAWSKPIKIPEKFPTGDYIKVLIELINSQKHKPPPAQPQPLDPQAVRAALDAHPMFKELDPAMRHVLTRRICHDPTPDVANLTVTGDISIYHHPLLGPCYKKDVEWNLGGAITFTSTLYGQRQAASSSDLDQIKNLKDQQERLLYPKKFFKEKIRGLLTSSIAQANLQGYNNQVKIISTDEALMASMSLSAVANGIKDKIIAASTQRDAEAAKIIKNLSFTFSENISAGQKEFTVKQSGNEVGKYLQDTLGQLFNQATDQAKLTAQLPTHNFPPHPALTKHGIGLEALSTKQENVETILSENWSDEVRSALLEQISLYSNDIQIHLRIDDRISNKGKIEKDLKELKELRKKLSKQPDENALKTQIFNKLKEIKDQETNLNYINSLRSSILLLQAGVEAYDSKASHLSPTPSEIKNAKKAIAEFQEFEKAFSSVRLASSGFSKTNALDELLQSDEKFLLLPQPYEFHSPLDFINSQVIDPLKKLLEERADEGTSMRAKNQGNSRYAAIEHQMGLLTNKDNWHQLPPIFQAALSAAEKGPWSFYGLMKDKSFIKGLGNVFSNIGQDLVDIHDVRKEGKNFSETLKTTLDQFGNQLKNAMELAQTLKKKYELPQTVRTDQLWDI